MECILYVMGPAFLENLECTMIIRNLYFLLENKNYTEEKNKTLHLFVLWRECPHVVMHKQMLRAQVAT